MAGVPDWTTPVQLQTAKIDITHVTVIDQVTKITSAKTTEVINKATTVVQTGDAFKLLLHGTQTSKNPGLAIAATLLKQPYSALLVRVQTAALATVYCVTVSPSFTIGTPPIVVSPAQFTAACAPLRQFVTTSVWQAVVPIASSPTENLTIDIYTSASHTYTIDILGLTSNPGVQLRSDGRAYPIGSHSAQFGSVTRTATLVTVASPLRVLVHSIVMPSGYQNTNLLFGILKGTKNGSATTALATWVQDKTGTRSAGLAIPESGILMDAGGDLVQFSSSSPSHIAQGTINYDLIV